MPAGVASEVHALADPDHGPGADSGGGVGAGFGEDCGGVSERSRGGTGLGPTEAGKCHPNEACSGPVTLL